MVMPGLLAPPTTDVPTLLHELCAAWDVDDLHDVVTVQFSDRLTHSFGHCIPADGRITIAQRLLPFPDVLVEVLAHEVAHFESWRRHPQVRRHHGPEWAELMRAAGFEPRESLPPLPGDPPPRAWTPGYYLHSCPRCAAQRIGRRPVRRWRCVACHSAGRGGHLHITRLDA